jgi:hypothetical protein
MIIGNRKGLLSSQKKPSTILMEKVYQYYNLLPLLEMKRKIPINKLIGITLSRHPTSDEFVIHVSGEHDYRLKTER